MYRVQLSEINNNSDYVGIPILVLENWLEKKNHDIEGNADFVTFTSSPLHLLHMIRQFFLAFVSHTGKVKPHEPRKPTRPELNLVSVT